MNAESAVLGCVLSDNRVWNRASEIVSGDDFENPTFGALFDAIGQHIAAGKPIDAMTLELNFPAWGILGIGPEEPYSWADQVRSYPEYVAELAETIRIASRRRRAQHLLASAIEDLHDSGHDPGHVLQRVNEVIGHTLNDRNPGQQSEYIDVSSVLDGSLHAPQTAAGGRRSDGLPLLYLAAVNVLLGAPEAGKTLIAGAMAADELFSGGSVLWVDLDHNGAAAILSRLRDYGVGRDILVNRDKFRLAIADSAADVLSIVAHARTWSPTLAVIDSVGELLPMFGAKSNDADEYTTVHRKVLAAIAAAGAAVLAIDHEAKGVESRNYGAGGTMAKKRAVDGALLRVASTTQFAPGAGGEAQLTIVKDRHGALRASASGAREPLIASFTLIPLDEGLGYKFRAPMQTAAIDARGSDIDALLRMTPPPTSVRDVRNRMSWGATRAQNALRAYREAVGERVETTYLEGSG